MSIRHLDRLLEPKSVVVIGASDRVGSVGNAVWRNLRAGHFAGPIYAVNPKHATLDAVGVFARRGTQRMVGYVLRENEAMRELAQSQGFVVDAVASDALFLALTLQAR